jgi:cellulose synthase/poly-beta-1,6-N-acetylglucosamine synthase-like glycosyltransferase
MKRALIATLYNEADNVSRWWDCLMRQKVMPDEIALVDGGSKDGTWEKLQTLAKQCPVPVKLEQRRCNIAGGRNRAIQLTDAQIIASNDAGSFPEPDWFGEITRPLKEDEKLDAVGGKSIITVENEFQKLLQSFESNNAEPVSGVLLCSSRNVAYRRQAWADVGGYPEWLTLTGEDALFTFQLHKIGKVFRYNPQAIVYWAGRENEQDYFKMLYSYGWGSAEARLFPKSYLVHFAVTLFPPLLLFSKRRLAHLRFRYLRNAACARGWLAGKLRGHSAPAGWRQVDGIYMSLVALRNLPK